MAIFDNFERGVDTNSIDTAPSSWSIVTGSPHISTEQFLEGTRSAKFSPDEEATVPWTAGSGYIIRFWLYKEAALNGFYCLHGNGTKRITCYVSTDGSIYYYDTGAKDTTKDITNDSFANKIEIKNINFVTYTYDIWLNNVLAKSGAAMQTNANNTNVVHIWNSDGTAGHDAWIDNFYVGQDNKGITKLLAGGLLG